MAAGHFFRNEAKVCTARLAGILVLVAVPQRGAVPKEVFKKMQDPESPGSTMKKWEAPDVFSHEHQRTRAPAYF